MRTDRARALLATTALVLIGPATAWAAEAVVGQQAPDFTVTDTNGQARSPAQVRGQFLVLEWHNHECPFVRKHYGSGNMQRLQQEATGKGVVWWIVNSSAPGKQGYVGAEEANALTRSRQAVPSAVLLDAGGTVGRRYGAKTTPHLFVIDPSGILIYAGAIDGTPSTDPADIPGAVNYVRQALNEAMAGQPVSVPQTTSYGCSVKY